MCKRFGHSLTGIDRLVSVLEWNWSHLGNVLSMRKARKGREGGGTISRKIPLCCVDMFKLSNYIMMKCSLYICLSFSAISVFKFIFVKLEAYSDWSLYLKC